MIVGVGTFGGVGRGFILTPIPEPGTWTLLAATGVGLLANRRFRHSFRSSPPRENP